VFILFYFVCLLLFPLLVSHAASPVGHYSLVLYLNRHGQVQISFHLIVPCACFDIFSPHLSPLKTPNFPAKNHICSTNTPQKHSIWQKLVARLVPKMPEFFIMRYKVSFLAQLVASRWHLALTNFFPMRPNGATPPAVISDKLPSDVSKAALVPQSSLVAPMKSLAAPLKAPLFKSPVAPLKSLASAPLCKSLVAPLNSLARAPLKSLAMAPLSIAMTPLLNSCAPLKSLAQLPPLLKSLAEHPLKSLAKARGPLFLKALLMPLLKSLVAPAGSPFQVSHAAPFEVSRADGTIFGFHVITIFILMDCE
jgi:hypothetical protein